MKIRTDFVTNSSSSSFVVYNLKNSAFCSYINKKIGVDNVKSDYYFKMDEESLEAKISYFGLKCDNYALEIWSPDRTFKTDINKIEKLIKRKKSKDEFNKILSEELGEKSIFDIIDVYDARNFYSDIYSEYNYDVELSDDSHMHLCSRLYQLLRSCEVNTDKITVSDDMIHILLSPRKEEGDFIDLFEDHMYLVSFDGYTKKEKQKDIDEMTKHFFDVIDEYIDIRKIGNEDDVNEAKACFDEDIKNGNFECDVYMGCTD